MPDSLPTAVPLGGLTDLEDTTGHVPDVRLADGAAGAPPNGARPDGARPDGARPDGARPDGARPDGARAGGGRRRAGPTLPDPAAFDQDDPRLVEARRRLAIVRFADQIAGGMPARAAAVKEAVRTPGTPVFRRGPAPSRRTLARWVARCEATGRTLAALIDLPSTGRPPQDLTGTLAVYLRQQVRARAAHYRLTGVGGRPRWGRLAERVAAYAEGKALRPPSKHAVRRFVLAIPPDERVLAAFGTKAARAMVAPKGFNVTRRAHELVFLDEVLLPTWIRVFHHRKRRWLAARAWAVFVVDAHSRAILAWWIKEPDWAAAHRLLHTHFTADEVVAVAASVLVPELQHPDLLTFARGEPGEIRMDGSGNTKAAAKRLADQGVHVTLGEANAPWTRGVVERFFQTLKDGDLSEVTGDKGLYLPFDPEREDPRTTRTRVNADRSRMESYRLEIPVESLADVALLRRVVHHIVLAYNATEHRGIRYRTPLSLYEETAPRLTAETGRRAAAVGLFPGHRRTVEPRGVELDNAWYTSDALHRAYPGESVVFARRDPLGRGAFVYPARPSFRARTEALFVPARGAWAEALDPAAFAGAIRDEYAGLRAAVNADREAVREDEIGGEAAAEVRGEIAERGRKQDAKRRKRGATVTADGEDTTATGRVVGPGGGKAVGGKRRTATAGKGAAPTESGHPGQQRRQRLRDRERLAAEAEAPPAPVGSCDAPPEGTDRGGEATVVAAPEALPAATAARDAATRADAPSPRGPQGLTGEHPRQARRRAAGGAAGPPSSSAPSADARDARGGSAAPPPAASDGDGGSPSEPAKGPSESSRRKPARNPFGVRPPGFAAG